MKKYIRLCSLVLSFILLSQLSLTAQNNNNDNENKKEKRYEFEKKKQFSKSYNIAASDKISIENNFGSVEIHVWNKQEIKVDVEIKVTAQTEDWAKSVLKDIQVDDSKKNNTISFKTLHMEDLDKKDGGNRKDKYMNKNTRQTMETNYIVYMPESNSLIIDNQFGPIILPDYKGEVDLTSKFGKLITGNLFNVKNINVEFGEAKLGNISGGKLSIKYSKATITGLSGNIKMVIEFSTNLVLNLGKNLSGLDVKASYATFNLKPVADLSASYYITTSFGSFKNNSPIKFSSGKVDDDHGPKFDHEYLGQSGSGSINIHVKTDFSTIIFGNATEEDMKEKSKEKPRRTVSI